MAQPFTVTDAELLGVKIIQPFLASDIRGEFIKDYSSEILQHYGINHELSEVFYTKSYKGVIRAIHFQRVKEQAKLVRVVKGRIFDIVVDLRPKSKTYGRWQGFNLDGKNSISIYIPEHFGHGYLVLEESIVSYKCSEKFYGEFDDGIRWDDPDIAIHWPLAQVDDMVILSDKDKKLQSFKEFAAKYVQEETNG